MKNRTSDGWAIVCKHENWIPAFLIARTRAEAWKRFYEWLGYDAEDYLADYEAIKIRISQREK